MRGLRPRVLVESQARPHEDEQKAQTSTKSWCVCGRLGEEQAHSHEEQEFSEALTAIGCGSVILIMSWLSARHASIHRWCTPSTVSSVAFT